MEDALAVCPIIPEGDLASLDASLVEWFKNSSVQHLTPRPQSPEPVGITVTKNVMRWRYLSSRIILHRPVLLWYAMRRMPFENLSQEKQHAVEVCREVTAELINDIASTWRAQQASGMSGWNATWLLYQAVMVPLLSLFSDPTDAVVVEHSRHQVEIALVILTELRGWSPTARRSFEVVSRIYEASKRLSPRDSQEISIPTEFQANAMGFSIANHPAFRPAAIDMSLNQEMLMDSMFDSLTWSTGWQNLDYPFDTPSAGWNYDAMNGWGGSLNFEGYFDPGFQNSTTHTSSQYSTMGQDDVENYAFQ